MYKMWLRTMVKEKALGVVILTLMLAWLIFVAGIMFYIIKYDITPTYVASSPVAAREIKRRCDGSVSINRIDNLYYIKCLGDMK